MLNLVVDNISISSVIWWVNYIISGPFSVVNYIKHFCYTHGNHAFLLEFVHCLFNSSEPVKFDLSAVYTGLITKTNLS